jgi:ABC-type amino acid transport substrate-binding protein
MGMYITGKRFYLIITVLIIISIITLFAVIINIKNNKSSAVKINLTTAEEEWLLKHNNIITYINDPEFAPVSFLDSTGNYTGISEDYIKLLEAKLIIKFKRIHTGTWKEAMNLAKDGKIDVVGAIAVTPERLKFLIFTPPFLTHQVYF